MQVYHWMNLRLGSRIVAAMIKEPQLAVFCDVPCIALTLCSRHAW